jgi:cephalosporin-C deacetylase
MTRIIHHLLVLFTIFIFIQSAMASDSGTRLRLEIQADRPDYMYSTGDTASLMVTIINPDRIPGPFTLNYRFSEDNVSLIETGELETTGGRAKLHGSLSHPGFLRLDLRLTAGADTLEQVCACGFSPLAIRPTNVLPEDFSLFWHQGRAELMRIPLDPKLEPVAADEPGQASRYLLSLANIEGSRIYGWLTVPSGPGPFPALVYVMGAPGGVHEYRAHPRSGYADAGMIVLAVNIHGIELGREDEYYRQLHAAKLLGYFPVQGCDDPYRYYYRRVVLGCLRALDYLCSRGDVDTDRLGIAGASQGGGLSLLVAAVDKRLKAIAVNVPAMCDHTGVYYGRPTGWPHLLERDSRECVRRTAGYFDGALAAGLMEIPALFTVSLLDEACPPTTVYAAYNNLKGPKRIISYPGLTHPQSFGEDRAQMLIEGLSEMLNRAGR